MVESEVGLQFRSQLQTAITLYFEGTSRQFARCCSPHRLPAVSAGTYGTVRRIHMQGMLGKPSTLAGPHL